MLDADARYCSGLVQGPSRDPWLTTPVTHSMDYYGSSDSTVLQEMLDMRSEIDCGINDGKPDFGLNGTDMPGLELDDDPIGWFGPINILNANSNSSNSNFNLDLNGSSDAASIMVNPNCVMPIAIRSSPSNNDKRHFVFPSKKEVWEEKIDAEEEDEVEEGEEAENEEDSHTENENENDNENEVENENENDTETEQYENDISETEEESEEEDEEDTPEQVSSHEQETITISAPKTSATQFIKAQTMQKINGIHGIKVQNIKVIQNANQTTQHLRKQIYNNNLHIGTGATTVVAAKEKDFDMSDSEEETYPKPAYSYSCLIAMALKNSRTGSLPVSDIYNFMCAHFPYFKKAPSGWKNSVRHNLSLNKCFEKIEKPAGNGNQRKGCLWAINPERAAKMDDELQKWSRKDPLAIKRAMIFPEHLELLERGKMKDGSSVVSEESSSDGTNEENRTYEESINDHITANSVSDSFDESSQDCDIDIHDHLYENIGIDDNKELLHMQLNISNQESFDYQRTSAPKRQKTLTGTIQGNYVYQPVTTSRRKTPLFVRAGTGNNSFLKID